MSSPQSWPSALIDLATLGALVAIAFGHVTEPAAWTLLGTIVAGRFGVSLGKEIGRVGSATSYRPPPDNGGGTAGTSTPRFQAVIPPPTSERDPNSMPLAPRAQRHIIADALGNLIRGYARRPAMIVAGAIILGAGLAYSGGCASRPTAAIVQAR